MEPIYLDHNATTPVLPEVVEAMLPYLREHYGNPSSAHAYGRHARKAIEHAREQVAALLGCAPDEILFTSGGTEANNLAIRGVAESSTRRVLVTSTVEHPATSQPCACLEQHGFEVRRVPVNEHGRIQWNALVELIADLIDRHGEARVVDLAKRLGVTHVTVNRASRRAAPTPCLYGALSLRCSSQPCTCR